MYPGQNQKPAKTKRLDFARHHYAVENMNQWIGEGFEFFSKLLYLSKCTGHASLESTHYYFNLSPRWPISCGSGPDRISTTSCRG